MTESLDYVRGRLKVVRHVREAFSCRSCESVVQAPAPHHAIAHIAVAKFDDHLPLYRQAEIYARNGVDLATSTLSALRQAQEGGRDRGRANRRTQAGFYTLAPACSSLRFSASRSVETIVASVTRRSASAMTVVTSFVSIAFTSR